ncbi:sensor histidine kinase [Longitalea luteola]|uniref:sensor histidine kinase n=1 Tax=Longitalea luteola TaxID=2812563 RepID=UPI001A971E57|nr:sensor histidine kinase [Longitalea luteola]
MLTIVKYRYFNVILHALAWSIVLFFPYFTGSAGNQYKIGPLPGIYFTLSQLIHIVIFYGNAFFLYPKLLNRRYWWLYLVSVVLLILLSVRVKFYILEGWFPNDLPDVRAHVLFPSVLAFIVSVFYCITLEKIRAEKTQQEREAKQLGMELKFLRSQISPHFLFNILTNLVSLARKRSDQLESSLLMLSGLMRYMLYDAGKKISLQQEVEYLQSYVALQQLRFGQDVKIGFNLALPYAANNYCIEPMLLIPFVENAFKHGTGYEDEPRIDINLTVQEGILVFQVKNKFDPGEAAANKDEVSGIGLGNVRARLTLLYPGRYDLVIHRDGDLFSIHLTLNLL